MEHPPEEGKETGPIAESGQKSPCTGPEGSLAIAPGHNHLKSRAFEARNLEAQMNHARSSDPHRSHSMAGHRLDLVFGDDSLTRSPGTAGCTGGLELAPSMILQPFAGPILPLVTEPNLLLEVGESHKHQGHANR